jgi:formate dehydrogenase iron-sulfur subunit
MSGLEIAIRRPDAERMGFFTDTTVCIGCKACEVACKQWNDLPADGASFRKGASYDHTGSLGASTWRHVRFVELLEGDAGESRWLFMSDVCKHCSHAGCLDACPTGALIRTEFGTVVLQPDVCNGCGYCIPACPFGVVDRDAVDRRAAKCTLCYDRLQDGLEPACAKACPTDSIQFGPYEELVELAERRVARLHEEGRTGAYLYGAGDAPAEEIAGGLGAFFLLTEPPERYGLPAHAESPIQEGLIGATVSATSAGLLAAAGVALAFVVPRRRDRTATVLGAATVATLAADVVHAARRRRSRR